MHLMHDRAFLFVWLVFFYVCGILDHFVMFSTSFIFTLLLLFILSLMRERERGCALNDTLIQLNPKLLILWGVPLKYISDLKHLVKQ